MTYLGKATDWRDGAAVLRSSRAGLNREDEAELIHHGKAIARSAILFPSLVDYAALRTAKLLIEEALAQEQHAKRAAE